MSRTPIAVAVAAVTVLGAQFTAADERYYRHQVSIPSVVVTVQNQAAQRGGFQTPAWAGVHDGAFDLYDRNVALGDTQANPNLISRESVERIAEDGITDPITGEFSLLQPGAPQFTFVAPGDPLQPGAKVATMLNVNDPTVERFFSYASMVIPSNDAFVANGNPQAHELFNERGRFVAGSEVLDAGTEVNDERAENTAFLNQAAPDTGVDEKGGVITLSDGFADPGALEYPDGVLNHPVFGNADCTAAGARTLQFSFRFVDLGRRVGLRAQLSPDNEVGTEVVQSRGRGRVAIVSRRGRQASVLASFSHLTGAPVMAHLHLGQAGTNGPVVVNLAEGLSRHGVRSTVRADDVIGPLADADDPYLALLN